MNDLDASMEELYYIQDDAVDPEFDRVKGILDEKYKLADLQKYVDACKHLMLWEQTKL